MGKQLTQLQLFLREEDKDIVDHMATVKKGKKSQFIRDAIREKIEREK